jgi:thiamine-monophosphate kinase
MLGRRRAMKITEERLIERIRRRVPSATGGLLRLGIGDDAAVLRAAAGAEWVVTSDPFIEDVHFLTKAHAPQVVGYKALARATSDLAAMGAHPEVFLLNLTIPANRTGRWLDGMLAGLARAARKFGLRLAGGDTAQSPRENPKVAIHITVMGTARRGRVLQRSGARAGDVIFVSGPLGAAQLGLELILRGRQRQVRWKNLLAPQFYPVPTLDLGQWLARRGIASAAMDLSDGLSSDLHRLCRASGAGARIYAEELPGVAVPAGLRSLRLDALTLALHGGEDYGLLFTVPRRRAARIPKKFGGTKLTRIGEMVRGRGVTLVSTNGKSSALEPRGWDHFRPGRQ